jgi:hypothetical protein
MTPELLQDKIYIKQKLISQRFQLYLIFLTFRRVKVRNCKCLIAFYSTKHSELRFKKKSQLMVKMRSFAFL